MQQVSIVDSEIRYPLAILIVAIAIITNAIMKSNFIFSATIAIATSLLYCFQLNVPH